MVGSTRILLARPFFIKWGSTLNCVEAGIGTVDDSTKCIIYTFCTTSIIPILIHRVSSRNCIHYFFIEAAAAISLFTMVTLRIGRKGKIGSSKCVNSKSVVSKKVKEKEKKVKETKKIGKQKVVKKKNLYKKNRR